MLPFQYQVLGLDPTKQPTTQEVDRAYYVRAHKCHPDRAINTPQATSKFVVLNEAYKSVSKDVLNLSAASVSQTQNQDSTKHGTSQPRSTPQSNVNSISSLPDHLSTRQDLSSSQEALEKRSQQVSNSRGGDSATRQPNDNVTSSIRREGSGLLGRSKSQSSNRPIKHAMRIRVSRGYMKMFQKVRKNALLQLSTRPPREISSLSKDKTRRLQHLAAKRSKNAYLWFKEVYRRMKGNWGRRLFDATKLQWKDPRRLRSKRQLHKITHTKQHILGKKQQKRRAEHLLTIGKYFREKLLDIRGEQMVKSYVAHVESAKAKRKGAGLYVLMRVDQEVERLSRILVEEIKRIGLNSLLNEKGIVQNK